MKCKKFEINAITGLVECEGTPVDENCSICGAKYCRTCDCFEPEQCSITPDGQHRIDR